MEPNDLPQFLYRRPGSPQFVDAACHVRVIGSAPRGYVFIGKNEAASFSGEVEIWERREESGEAQ